MSVGALVLGTIGLMFVAILHPLDPKTGAPHPRQLCTTSITYGLLALMAERIGPVSHLIAIVIAIVLEWQLITPIWKSVTNRKNTTTVYTYTKTQIELNADGATLITLDGHPDVLLARLQAHTTQPTQLPIGTRLRIQYLKTERACRVSLENPKR